MRATWLLINPDSPQGNRPQSGRVTFADGYNTSASPFMEAQDAGPSRRRRSSTGILKPTVSKRSLDDDDEWDEADHLKKTRVEGGELIDGDEEANWYTGHTSQGPLRGSKRGILDDASERSKDKRARKSPQDDGTLSDDIIDDMDIDEYGDVVTDLPAHVRGKKRDRGEAGSTFGDEDEDASVELDDKARRRKRRNKRKSDADASRGTKRDRDADVAGDAFVKASKNKRGRKSQTMDEEDKASDVSMDDASARPVKREIGDEWENNGVRYKLGLNGQRLRQDLVKRSRQKFNMVSIVTFGSWLCNLCVFIASRLDTPGSQCKSRSVC